jgi:hypothetical protein
MYIKILDKALLESIGDGRDILAVNEAPVHTTHVSTMWFVDSGIEVLRLPCAGESLQSKLRMVGQFCIDGISRSTIRVHSM